MKSSVSEEWHGASDQRLWFSHLLVCGPNQASQTSVPWFIIHSQSVNNDKARLLESL